MSEDERKAQLEKVLRQGLRLGLEYEDGQFWWLGFILTDKGEMVRCCRVRVEWLLTGEESGTE